MPAELMYGQKPVIPIEKTITSWVAIPWENEMNWEELLAAWIRLLERRPEDIEHARKIMDVARVKNKIRFDKIHRLRPKKIEEGDWVLVYDNSLDNQHKTTGWKHATVYQLLAKILVLIRWGKKNNRIFGLKKLTIFCATIKIRIQWKWISNMKKTLHILLQL